MRGYGDPELGGLGYGDPETLAGAALERGYGSPDQEALLFLELESSRVHHRGGARIFITGALPDSLAPYRLSVQVGGQRVYLYSGSAGQGPDLIKRKNKLEAYTPPAPTGSYPITLHCGPSFTSQFLVNSPLQILPDNRASERYAVRRAPPSYYATGARFNGQDPVDLALQKPSIPPFIHQVLDIFGRVSQEQAGSAQTVLARDHSQGEQTLELESVLGFPEQGAVFIDRQRYIYSLNANLLTLNTGLRSALAELEEVILDAF